MVGGRPNLVYSQGPGLKSWDLGPYGPDLGPDLDLTWDLDLDLSLTILPQIRKVKKPYKLYIFS